MNQLAEAIPIPTISPIATQLTFAVIGLGFYLFVQHAWKRRKDSYRLKNFFLAGGTLGAPLTENTTIGNTFAWSGGIWFFATVAYAFGPWVVLLQIPWCLSIVFVGHLFSKIHAVTKNRTIHGFLGATYNSHSVRVAACLATTIGYIFNAGFEMYWSGKMFATSFGLPNLTVFLGLLLAMVAAAYCGIGGYRANASTDKPQNILGVLALAAIALCTAFATNSDALRIAAVIFAAGSAIYILVSLVTKNVMSDRESKWHSGFSIILASIAVILALWLAFGHLLSASNDASLTLLKSSPFPWHLLVGLIGFQLFFNIVDMANWQSIAANGDIPNSQHGQLSWAMIRSALYLNWFPALGGALIGLALRASTAAVNDENIFQVAFSTVFPASGDILRGLVLGVLLLGLLSTTLSTADSYLMAATQTLTYDIFYPKTLSEILSEGKEDIEAERAIVKITKRLLIPLAFLMVIIFWQAYLLLKKVGGDALQFQMVMYAFALSLFAPVTYALWKGEEVVRQFRRWAFCAIVTGVIAGFAPYLTAIAFHFERDNVTMIVNLTPLFSLVLSTFVFATPIMAKYLKSKTVKKT